MRASVVLLIVLNLFAGTARAATPIPCGECVSVSVTPAQAASIAAAADSLSPLTILVRAETPADLPAAASAVEALSQRGARAGIAATFHPNATGTIETGTIRGELAVLDLSWAPWIDAALAFDFKTAATAIRGNGVKRIGVVLASSARAAVREQGLTPYIDFAVGPFPIGSPTADPLAGIERWTTMSGAAPLNVEKVLTAASETTAARVLVTLPEGGESLVPVLAALAAVVPRGMATLLDVQVSCDVKCESEAFLDATTLEAVALVRAASGVTRVRVLPRATRITAVVPSLAPLVPQPGAEKPWRVVAEGNEMALPGVSGPIVIRVQGWRARTEEAFATGVEVKGSRSLSVEEILARHQAARAKQSAAVTSLISTGSTVLTFNAPGFSAPVAVTARTTVFSSREGTEVEQRDIRVNGLRLATRGDEIPRLPLIEPERVVTPPLVIALTEAYRYQLEGVEKIGSRSSYVVSFEPRLTDRTLYAGRAWIDAETFGLVRIDSLQTALPGPVVTSRQVDDFEAAVKDGSTLWFPSHSEINQTYETANYSTPIRRVVTLTGHLVNPPDFAARLEAAHASDAVMMKDTPQGYRYLRRSREPAASGGTARTVVQGRAESVLTVAGGVTVDPNISVPLVFGGVSYLNFNLFGRGAQVDAFFGGLYARLAWAGPPLARSGWRLSGDLFGIAVSYNDRSFRSGIEQYNENISQRPLHFSAGIVGPLTRRWRLRIAYEMDYTHYERSDSTGQDFVVPPSTAVHASRFTLERQFGPWTFAGWWNGALRQRWTAWGPDALEPPVRRFNRFGVRLTRSFVWSPNMVGHAELAWMDGLKLDRFSRYAFGTFDNPLRGYPNAAVRYDRGFVFRSALSWTAATHLRVDGFADMGIVRDPGMASRLRGFPGIGLGLEAPLPFGLLAGVEWGYGFAARRSNGATGTQVVKVSAYKVF